MNPSCQSGMSQGVKKSLLYICNIAQHIIVQDNELYLLRQPLLAFFFCTECTTVGFLNLSTGI